MTSSKSCDVSAIPEVSVKNVEVATEEAQRAAAASSVLATGADSEAVFACEVPVATMTSREFGAASSDSQLCVDDAGTCSTPAAIVASGGDVIKGVCSTSHLPVGERATTGRMIQGSRSTGNQRSLSSSSSHGKQPHHNHSMNNHTSGVVVSGESTAAVGGAAEQGNSGRGAGSSSGGSVTVNVGRHYQKHNNGSSNHTYRSRRA